MRYFDRMITLAHDLTNDGWIVLMPFVAIMKDDQEDSKMKEMLDEMHRAKIDLSEEIVIVGPYIGKSTQAEIEYARDHGIRIRRQI